MVFVVAPLVGDDAVSAVMNLITYLVESTVFTSVTLLPFPIVTFDWPLENDPPATLISIFFAVTESRTNTGEADGKAAVKATSSGVPLTKILAATYLLCGVVVVDLVVLLVVVGDGVVIDALEEVVAPPNGSLMMKRLNLLSCPEAALYLFEFGSDPTVSEPKEGVPLEFVADKVEVV